MKNHYEILGVDENADAKTIKKAYRKLAQKYHPDKNQGDETASDKFKEINEAYDTLSDDHKRAQYDAVRAGGFGGRFEFGAGQNPFDLFIQFFGGGFPGQEKRFTRPSTQRKSDDRIVNFKIPLSELKSGVLRRSVDVADIMECNSCSGKGGDISEACGYCSGLGVVTQTINYGSAVIQNTQPCVTCAGRGKLISGMCAKCKGKGKIKYIRTYDITINCNERGR